MGSWLGSSPLLEETLALCKQNEPIKGDDGDSARVMRTLADSLKGQGKIDEGEVLRQEAESIREKLQGDGYKDLPDISSSWDALVSILYR